MVQSTYFKKYYQDNKDKFEAYVLNTPKIRCDICNKSYKFTYYEKHIQCNLHKKRAAKVIIE